MNKCRITFCVRTLHLTVNVRFAFTVITALLLACAWLISRVNRLFAQALWGSLGHLVTQGCEPEANLGTRVTSACLIKIYCSETGVREERELCVHLLQ